ncbi:MAG: hypothetical protein EP330_20835 [Deltaproteobacteria bacterium]|nr:MAG: hypothetical protein EP330_20835 [Deltaproteobacteria bacterium]
MREGRPYRDVAEIVRARGVGPATLAQLEGHVFVHDAVPAPRRVDLNCDGERRLQSLPRVGPVIAARIVAARPFAQLDDLERVSGIGPATVARLDGEVVLGDCR